MLKMPVIHAKNKPFHPTKLIVLSFLLVIIVGTFLLMLPISSRRHEFTPFITALFTATSATCVTGLVVVDTYTHWNAFGQLIILLMIQIGGIGLVTFASFFNLIIGKKIGLRTMQLASESVSMGGFDDIKKLLTSIMKICLSFEGAGALLLMIVFVPKYGLRGIWISIFLSVSAFCNAGFDPLGFEGEFCSLMNYADNPIVTITIMLLIVCGGLGFVVWNDLAQYKKTEKLILHTKVVLLGTAILIAFGTLSVLILEWNNPHTLGGLNFFQKLIRALFQSITYRTAGFNTIPINEMYSHTKILGAAIMFIGAAPGSTGGGIKVTTLMVLLMTVVSVVKNQQDTIMLKRKVDKDVVYKSISISALAGLAVTITTAIIMYTNNNVRIHGVDALFESVSAFATVGLSAGPTLVVNKISLVALIITMFIGRVGPVSFMASLMLGRESNSKNQVVPEGKVLVG
jgi:trk system potassium uptake protein TrkH